MVVSSAKLRMSNVVQLQISLTYTRNRIGPSMDPCGTAQVSDSNDDFTEPNSIYCFLFER